MDWLPLFAQTGHHHLSLLYSQFLQRSCGVVCNSWLDLIRVHLKRGALIHAETHDVICQGSDGLMIHRKFSRANPTAECFIQDVKDGKCKTKNVWFNVLTHIFWLFECNIYSSLCFNYRDWLYNETSKPMPISVHHMTISLQTALKNARRSGSKRKRSLLPVAACCLLPLLAQLFGLFDYLKKWN